IGRDYIIGIENLRRERVQSAHNGVIDAVDESVMRARLRLHGMREHAHVDAAPRRTGEITPENIIDKYVQAELTDLAVVCPIDIPPQIGKHRIGPQQPKWAAHARLNEFPSRLLQRKPQL